MNATSKSAQQQIALRSQNCFETDTEPARCSHLVNDANQTPCNNRRTSKDQTHVWRRLE